jgi:hypothetical protein
MVIGFLSATFIIPIIQQPRWTVKMRALVTFAFSLLVGAGNAFFNGDFNLHDITQSVLVLLVSAVAIYKGFAQPTGIATAIEEKTALK